MPIPIEGPFHWVGVDVIQFVKSHSVQLCSLIILPNSWRCLQREIRLHSLLLSYLWKRLCVAISNAVES